MHLITKNDNAWNGLISRVKFGHGLVDTVTGQKLSFTREGSGLKRFDTQLVYLGLNVPRVENNGHELRLEGSATNMLPWSSAPTTANGWTSAGCTSVPSGHSILSKIDGTPIYAHLLTATSANGRMKRENLSVTSGAIYSLSVYGEQVNSAPFRMGFSDGTNDLVVSFNPATRAFTVTLDAGTLFLSSQYEVIDSEAGIYRAAIIFTANATSTAAAISMGLFNSGAAMYVSGLQLEAGPAMTSYIYTEGTTVTRVSEGSDTSNNGLTMPLSQAMIDSLKGEVVDWSTAWAEASAPTGTYATVDAANRKITWSGTFTSSSVYKSGNTLVLGATYETSITISGRTQGSLYIRTGSSNSGATRTSNGTFVERLLCTGAPTFYATATSNFDGTVVFNYCRRVLDSGQTNPGEGTVLCGVYLPWPTSVLAPGNSPIITPTTGGFFYFNTIAGPTSRLYIYDGVSIAKLDPVNLLAGAYVLIAQFSARTGQMRAGLYNPATGVLTWGNYATYRGFFPITTTGGQRMRWFYGGGNFPVSLTEYRWLNRIASDTEVLKHCEEMKI